jgi:hypothetical protein
MALDKSDVRAGVERKGFVERVCGRGKLHDGMVSMMRIEDYVGECSCELPAADTVKIGG